MIGVYRRDDLPQWEERPATLALWRLADPGNVGTLIRTADAFGAAVALSDGCADPTSPKALRASAGSIWRVPLGRFDVRLGANRVALEAHGGVAARLASTSPGGSRSCSARSATDCRPRWSATSTRWIPIAGAESLNVAASGAIALYEWRGTAETRCQNLALRL